MGNNNVIKLQHPVDLGDSKMLEEVTIAERLKVKHLKSMPQEFMNFAETGGSGEGEKQELDPKEMMKLLPKMIPFLASILDLEESIVDEISVEDLMNIVGHFNSFFGGSSDSSSSTGEN